MEERFPNMMAKQSKTFLGMMSTIKDTAQQTLGQVMAPLFKNLTDTVLPGAAKALEGLSQIMSGDIGDEGANKFKEGIAQSVNGLVSGLSAMLPTLIYGLSATIVSLAQAIPTMLPPLMNALIVGFTQILSQLPVIIPALVDAVSQVFGMLVQQLPTLLPLLLNGVILLVTSLASQLGVIIPILIPVMIDTLNALAGVLVDNLPLIIASAKTLWNGIVTALNDLSGVLWESVKAAGRQLAEGLWNGISDKAQWLKDKISGWVGDVTSWVKDFFGIHSPSKVFADLGKQLPAGLAEGIKGGISLVSDAIGNMNGAAISPTINASSAPSSGSITISPGAVQINVTGNANPTDIAAAVESALKNLVRQSYALGRA
jgi:phage-related protein